MKVVITRMWKELAGPGREILLASHVINSCLSRRADYSPLSAGLFESGS